MSPAIVVAILVVVGVVASIGHLVHLGLRKQGGDSPYRWRAALDARPRHRWPR